MECLEMLTYTFTYLPMQTYNENMVTFLHDQTGWARHHGQAGEARSSLLMTWISSRHVYSSLRLRDRIQEE